MRVQLNSILMSKISNSPDTIAFIDLNQEVYYYHKIKIYQLSPQTISTQTKVR